MATSIDKDNQISRMEERFRTIIEALPNGIIMVDSDGKISLFNKETVRLFGYLGDELDGMQIENLVPERFRQKHPEYRKSFFHSPQTRAMGAGRDLYGRRKDGSEFPIEIGLNPLKNDDGFFVLAAIVDITERTAAEERFRSVVEANPNALVIVDSEGKIIFVNSQTEQLFGFPRNDMIGKAIEIIVPHRFRDQHPRFRDNFFANLAARPMGAGRDLFGLRADGVEFPVEIGLKPIQIDGRQMVLAAIVDISERKQVDAKLRQANAELQQKNQEMEQFIYTVSHDLKSPIVTSMSFLQFIREDLNQNNFTEIDDSLNRLEKANRRMSQLTNDLLRLSRIGRLELNPEMIDMRSLISEVVRDLRESFDDTQSRVEIQKDMPALRADRSRLLQLFENLLSNAFKYGVGRDDSLISIGSELTAGEVRYFVGDNGSGIPPEFHKKIFGLFERLVTNKEGTGVGLSIVLRVAQLHGGRAWVESREDEGAKFWVAFPRALLCEV